MFYTYVEKREWFGGKILLTKNISATNTIIFKQLNTCKESNSYSDQLVWTKIS